MGLPWLPRPLLAVALTSPTANVGDEFKPHFMTTVWSVNHNYKQTTHAAAVYKPAWENWIWVMLIQQAFLSERQDYQMASVNEHDCTSPLGINTYNRSLPLLNYATLFEDTWTTVNPQLIPWILLGSPINWMETNTKQFWRFLQYGAGLTNNVKENTLTYYM